jgi:hypothetical protein
MSQASVHDESMSKEQLHALGEKIATFAAKLDVATHALITQLREFDEHEGWADAEMPTCAHWLSWRTGIGLNAAREKVRVARALGELRLVDKLFGKGKLSFSKVRAITRVATPASEQDFIDIALNATALQVERLCGAYRRTHEDKNAPKPKPKRYVRRSKTFGGMERIEMQLPPEEAKIVWDALMSAMDANDEPGKDEREASNLEGATAGTDAPAEEGAHEEAPEGAPHVERATQGGQAATADVTAETREPTTADVTAETREPTTADITAETREPTTADVTAETREPTTVDVTAVTREPTTAQVREAPGTTDAPVGEHEGQASDGDGPLQAELGRGSDETAERGCGSARTSAETSDRERDVRDDHVSTEPHEHADECCVRAPALPANDWEALEEARADAMVDLARAYLKLRPQTLGSGYELVVITTQERLEKGVNEVGAVMRDGTPLPLEVARMLACDSARVNVTADQTGALLDVGRSTRTIPPAIGRALWLRDGCCRAPGCGRRRHLQAHHIQHWADGGPTCMANLILLCNQHHKAVHEGRLFVEIRDGKVVFRNAHGLEHPTAPPAAATGEELEALERFLRDADLHIDPSLNEPMWDGTPLDLDDALAWMSVADETRSVPAG